MIPLLQVVRPLIQSTINIEGGVFNHPSDIGGLTQFGIASKYNPEVKEKIEVGNFTKEDALMIYYNKYWLGSKAAELYNLGYRGIAYLIFDNFVAGHRFVTMYLQALIFLLTDTNGKVDGKFGNESIAALRKLGQSQQEKLIRLIEPVARELGSLTAKRTMRSQEKAGLPVYDFTEGFTNRIVKKLNAAKEAIYGREYNPH